MSFGQLRPIIGGGPVNAHEYPYVVHLSIETRPSWHAVCGGTLISAKHIVTAAHCVFHTPSPHAIKVGYGHAHTQRQRTAKARAFYIHDGFDSRTLANDIAVIELEAPIRETREAHRVAVYFGPIVGGHMLRTMGWGVTSNEPGAHTVALLNRVDLAVAAPAECRKVDRAFVSSNGPFVCTSTAGGRDECSGDSGAPAIMIQEAPRFSRSRGLLWNRKKSRRSEYGVRLVALTSYGDNTSHDAHPLCGDPGGFGFSTHVAYYHEFITNVTGLTQEQMQEPVRLDRLGSSDTAARQTSSASGALRMGPLRTELCVHSALLLMLLVFVSRHT
ncbi:Transmembrane protease serine 11D [Coemansia sp. RSA 1813]|nr:Transmembrane protease serine 11D [Coemansia sp. RSA 1646]KAJ1768646.1 Transmembrane protease serine 11D [Coemansia sp. RSA 1843]KAJ2086561.1 Transmembrane protease serine 11D [Coemansia sp. RSA 986]KAJ2211216.1 Transmembrane protease serine 11D [Coemansia sp. RSA 487]KAJ2565051.1 Transmembrane protease serine 11D [Coemansia sp. RSA 1813]